MLLSALKKLFAMGLAAVLMTSSLSCYAEKIGISLPNPDKPRFNLDGEVLKSELDSNGQEAIVKCGDRTAETQIKDIEEMIAHGCDYLVIVPVDGTALGDVLNKAKEKNVTVISYDRLIMNSDAVSYYATFDNYKVGEIMAEYLVKKLNLTQSGGDPKYIEFFSGVDTPMTEVVGFLFHRPQHSELRLTRSLGELLLQLFSTGLKFRMPYGIVSISGY